MCQHAECIDADDEASIREQRAMNARFSSHRQTPLETYAPGAHPPCPQHACCYCRFKEKPTGRRTASALYPKAATYTATRSGAARIVVAGRSG